MPTTAIYFYAVSMFLVLSYVYSKQPMFGLTQEWFRQLSFSSVECEVHDKLHITSAVWWGIFTFPGIDTIWKGPMV